jgi:Ser/Thr protein kinase RdoA (MazF antagonist)
MAGPVRSSPYARSVLAAEAVRGLVADAFGIEATGCHLVRSLVNEVYAVETAGGRYAFKLYRTWDDPRARSLAEVVWEQELAVALLDGGLTVPAPVPLTNGDLAGRLDAPEGPRPYALTTWVAGTKPQPPYSDDLYRSFGALTARFHEVAGGYVSRHDRSPLEPVDSIGPVAQEVAEQLEGDDRQLVLTRAGEAVQRLERLVETGMTWGVRHGDVTLDNLHTIGAGLALHDFDRSGPGWLVADLTGVQSTPHWDAFLNGYQQLRALTEPDLAALPALQAAGLIANLQFHLIDKPRIFGSESRGEGWVERELVSLRGLELGQAR